MRGTFHPQRSILHAVVCFGMATVLTVLHADDGRSLAVGAGAPGFGRIDSQASAIHFTNVLSREFAAANQIRMNGSGVALGDVDGDGRCDVFLCGVQTPARLYRNRGDWKFEDVTAACGVDLTGIYSVGAALADMDGDGDLDLLVTCLGGGTRLYVNDGRAGFTGHPDSGLISRFGATSMALADVDGDGDLDVYVTHYRTRTIRSTGFSVMNVNGRRMIRPEDRDSLEYTPAGTVLEHGEPDVLYLNDGNAQFTPVPWDGGTFLDENGAPLKQPPRDWGLAVQFRDFNRDGAPDLYVCNDFHSVDRLWVNDGKGCFRAIDATALRCTPTFSMCVDFADINRDGFDDLFTADMMDRTHSLRIRRSPAVVLAPGDFERAFNRPQSGRNTLHLGRPDGTFAEVAYAYGVQASGWTWACAFLDVDLDGFEDLLTTAGNIFDTQDLDANARIDAGGPYRGEAIGRKALQYDPHPQPRQLFRNVGGTRFEEVGRAWGFGEDGVCHGMAAGDLDGDGDLDLVVNELNGAAGVYRNQASAGRVAVRLKGTGKNTRGLGARITLRGGAVREQSQEMMGGGRYLSSDDAVRVFASGAVTDGMELEVRWRSGRRSVVKGVRANREYEIDESTALEAPAELRPEVKPWFREIALGHTHREEPFDDFGRQPLLPRRLSGLGPGVGWMDVDGDGLDDAVVGGGRGGAMAVFRNTGKGAFEPLPAVAAARDQTGLAALVDGGGRVRIVSGSSNFEDESNLGGGVEEWIAGAPGFEKTLGGAWSAVGPVALGDVDGDGTPELFVGSRTRAGRYPEADGSRLLRRVGTEWLVDATNTAVLQDAGMVSGAVWTDVDGDGRVDLVVATEWGPLKVYRNRKGTLESSDMGLGKYRGFWNGVTSGDFDGDGRMDLVASNWGTNTRHGRERMYFGDLGGQGQVEVVESEVEGGRWLPVRDLEVMSRVMPWVREKYGKHRAYAEATVEEVLSGKKAEMREVEWLETSVFLNRGDHFELKRLPAEAQWAVGYGVSVGDADGDGREDVFLAQNFFGVGTQESRSDGGRGLWLKGDGKGGFTAVDGSVSGVKVYGEGRGTALGDFDGDGRLDLLVGENGGETRVYRNESAKVGLQVRLEDGMGRYGAKVRVEYVGGRKGPARETHSGSGYWSQEGRVVVMGLEEPPVAVEVEWPGGKKTRAEVVGGV